MKKPICIPDPDFMAISDEAFDRLYGAVVVVSISGGKDSTALSLHLKEIGIEHARVFADTGWEHEWTYEHLDYLEKVLGPIDRVQSERGGMVETIRHKTMFPSRIARWCTQELKVEPIKKYILGIEEDTINVVGIRGGESSARAKMPKWEWSDGFDCWVWRPLIDWSVEDVIAIHNRHNVKPNRLYLEYNVDRVGCYPCIHSRKTELKTVAATSPERIDLIEQLEEEIGAAKLKVYEARGENYDTPGNWRPTFFNKSIPGAPADQNVPIREAVDWANTARGGRQRELFHDHSGGCMRWGLCETSSEPPPSSEADSTEEDGE